MTIEKKIEMLRRMLDGDDMDADILKVYLDQAKAKILNRMYQFPEFYEGDYDGMDVPDRYVGAQLNISCYLINRIGAEGEIQHIENGIHRNYGSADVPDAMMKDIVPFCKAIR